MSKEAEKIGQLTKEFGTLSEKVERTRILNDILRYLIRTHQSVLNYDEIEKIIKNWEKKK